MKNKPNILYIHSHDSGRYVQPYGFNVQTPIIQKLAEDGVLFRKAFSGAPQCCPSRAALLTGEAAHSCGQFGLVNRGFELRDRYKHIANHLKNSMYHTQLIGVQHEVWDPITCGYKNYVNTSDRHGSIETMDYDTATNAAQFIINASSEPFFLAVGFASTHRDFAVNDLKDDPRYCAPPLPLPDTPEIRSDIAAYKTSARNLDLCIGVVIDALKKARLFENTLIICTTDHGIAFPKMKCNLTDHGIGVMLIICGPQGFSDGKVIDSIVSHIDVFPTICDLINIDHPEWLQGNSLIPLIRSEKEEINEEIFAEQSYHCAYEPMRAVRTKRWKYIRRYSDYGFPMPSNVDNSPSKDLLIDHDWADQDVEHEELYDVILDPCESDNKINVLNLQKIADDMRKKLDKWMRSTDDPLLKGAIPVPEKGYVCDPTDISPYDIWDRVKRPKGYG